jgi:hypothetical protein
LARSIIEKKSRKVKIKFSKKMTFGLKEGIKAVRLM